MNYHRLMEQEGKAVVENPTPPKAEVSAVSNNEERGMNVRRFGFAAALAAGSCFVTVLERAAAAAKGSTPARRARRHVVVKREKAGGGGAAAANQATAPARRRAGRCDGRRGHAQGHGDLRGHASDFAAARLRKGQNIKDAICAKQTIPDQKLVVDPSGGVANVVIFLAKAPPGAVVPPPPTERGRLRQQGMPLRPARAA